MDMDLLMYNNYKQSNIMCDEQFNYIIISFLISYAIFISIIMLIKQFKETEKDNEEEILLANYITQEKTLVYKEELTVLFEKK